MRAVCWLRLAWLALLLAVAPARAQPDGLPDQPMLRINAPAHIALIHRIAIDAAEHFAVTASDDKTVRVWSLPNGALQRVIWLPSGEGDLGKAYAVALSPDGGTIAVGGWTSPSGLDTNIYLFDRASGALVRRLPQLPTVVNHLAFSPDGRRLAAALFGGSGIRVFDAGDGYKKLPSDGDYARANSLWVDFDHDNRLVSASFDGFVRLYARDRYDKPAVKKRVRGIGRPRSVAFSSDGRHVAVSDRDSATIAVLRDRDLQPEIFPAVTGLDAIALTVAWSQDGRQLFAEGMDPRNPYRLARRWDNAGAGRFIDIAGTRTTVVQFVPLRGGRMLFADAAGFGLIDPAGKVTRLQDQGSIDTRGAKDTFKISTDVRTVQVEDLKSSHVLRFALARRTVAFDPAEDSMLNGAVTSADRIKLTHWDGEFAPKLNGAELALYPDETSRSVALVPGTDRFVLGAEWSLRLFDAAGKEVWRQPRSVPAAVWGVNVSANGRLIVAAYGDGTIRWHRTSDGAELLALFIAPDGQRWVAWTPQGYYDASTGADDLIGWQVNHGYDQAPDFFPVAQFQERFNRRDVIARVLDTLDEDQAVEQANAAAGLKGAKTAPLTTAGLTPVVTIVDPVADSDQTNRDFKLSYVARRTTPDPIERVEALVDGVPVKAQDVTLDNGPEKKVGSLSFMLPLRDTKISVIAYNANGPSAPASIVVHWKGAGREDKVTLFVLAIGVTDYKTTGLPPIQFPAKDAHDFVALAKLQRGGPLYGQVVPYPKYESMENEDATHDNILDGLDWILHAVENSGDVAMIFLSGHGVSTPDQHYRYLPYDYDPKRIERTTISDTEFQQYITKIRGKTLFFFDTCFSGGVLGGKAADTKPDVDKFANELRSAKNGVVVFASSTGDELSLEPPKLTDPNVKNGAFTAAVLDGMRGKAAHEGVEVVSLTDLNSYIVHTVHDLTSGNQHPTFAMPKTVQDYPIASVVR
jgi:WD40 repeat protein